MHRLLFTSAWKAIQEHGSLAHQAVAAEITQLFKTKKSLYPLKKEMLTEEQSKRIIRSSMFLKAQYNALGEFEKVRAKLVANGHVQDRFLHP
jgi:hypothetical protein